MRGSVQYVLPACENNLKFCHQNEMVTASSLMMYLTNFFGWTVTSKESKCVKGLFGKAKG